MRNVASKMSTILYVKRVYRRVGNGWFLASGLEKIEDFSGMKIDKMELGYGITNVLLFLSLINFPYWSFSQSDQ